MKTFIATIAATLISTAAFAEKSDRYNDLRLNTAVQEFQSNFDAPTQLNFVSEENTPAGFKFGVERRGNAGVKPTKGEGNPYGGFGPYNDSR